MAPSRFSYRSNYLSLPLKLSISALVFLFVAALCNAQEIVIGVTYVCSGEHIYVEACNVRDTSDTATCMVAHPDHLTPTGLNSYTSMTRADLKKLLPTCTQPTPQQVAAAKAFQKKQQDTYNANAQKAEDQLKAATQPVTVGQPQKPKTPEERAMARCVTSGRLPATCTGNSLLGWFSDVVTQVLPSAKTDDTPGPIMAGVFEGPGRWRLDFITDGVLVNCANLSPDQHHYKVEFRGDHPLIVVDTTPKPLALSFRADGTIAAPGPLQIDGVVATGYQSGGSSYGTVQKDSAGNLYDSSGNRIYGNVNNLPGHATFGHVRVTCPALSLSTKGASVGVETMQTDLLKTMVGGDKGPPTPPGIRMRGIFATSTGFSVQFFPESVILGCGPDAARAYPYTVVADAGKLSVQISAPDHPLTLTYKADGSLDPGASSPYQVHGRIVTGQNNDGVLTFAPMEQTCNLASLTPSKTIPSGGGAASTMTASAGARGTTPDNGGGTLSVPAAPLGNATFSLTSGFPKEAGVLNPLAGHPYVILRHSYADVVAKAGVAVPVGMSAYKFVGTACGTHTPDCQKVMDAIKADAASAARGDANGRATLPGVPPGSYYLMISTRYKNQALIWGQAVQLKSGSNSMTLDQSNATPLN
jgi:hypothetical protein